jgi:hypothetical protein
MLIYTVIILNLENLLQRTLVKSRYVLKLRFKGFLKRNIKIIPAQIKD